MRRPRKVLGSKEKGEMAKKRVRQLIRSEASKRRVKAKKSVRRLLKR